MNIRRATRSYETWLAEHTRLAPADFAIKHANMAQDKAQGLFTFFRATCYRWAQHWPEVCPELTKAPAVLSVGDLHVANFGTWRNADRQLVWGINDPDEAELLPYTADLVRLACSASLGMHAADLDMALPDACQTLLTGYRAGLQAGGRPFVVSQHPWLHKLTTSTKSQQDQWWRALQKLPDANPPIEAAAQDLLNRLLPAPNLKPRIVHREAGAGSLGRQRWTALALSEGQWVASEIKAVAPSAWAWAAQRVDAAPQITALLGQAVRSRDLYVGVEQGWITRRLAPDNRRIEFEGQIAPALPQLLHAMGWETANQHLGSPAAIPAVLHDLEQRPANWLAHAAAAMAEVLRADWKEWRRNPL